MKKLLTLCVLFSMLFFVAPALIADVNEVELGSNLSFTFEPSSMEKKSLTIIPFAEFDFSPGQEEPTVETGSADLRTIVFGLGATLVVIFALTHAWAD